MPDGWERALVAIARFYHFPPESLWAMDAEELRFWLVGANELTKE